MFNRSGFNRLRFNRSAENKASATLAGRGFFMASASLIISAEETTMSGSGSFYAYPAGNRLINFSGTGSIDISGKVYLIAKLNLSGTGNQEISGNASRLKIFKYLGNLEPGKILIINTDNKTITKDGINTLKYFQGNFFDLKPGNNELTWEDFNTSRKLSLTSSFRRRYV